jgi:hypothetical protein
MGPFRKSYEWLLENYPISADETARQDGRVTFNGCGYVGLGGYEPVTSLDFAPRTQK